MSNLTTQLTAIWKLNSQPCKNTDTCPIWQLNKKLCKNYKTCPIWQLNKRPCKTSKACVIYQLNNHPYENSKTCTTWQLNNQPCGNSQIVGNLENAYHIPAIPLKHVSCYHSTTCLVNIPPYNKSTTSLVKTVKRVQFDVLTNNLVKNYKTCPIWQPNKRLCENFKKLPILNNQPCENSKTCQIWQLKNKPIKNS